MIFKFTVELQTFKTVLDIPLMLNGKIISKILSNFQVQSISVYDEIFFIESLEICTHFGT